MEKFGSGWKNSDKNKFGKKIRDKHPGSAITVSTISPDVVKKKRRRVPPGSR